MASTASAGPSVRVYEGALVRIGRFRCATSDPCFSDSGPTAGHLMVFPREAVTITHAGGRPLLADATRVMFYNRGQEYRRAAVSPAGDRCEWFAFDAEVVHAAVRAHAPRASEPERPFGRLADGPSDARSYLAQRRLFEHVSAPPDGRVDALEVEERALALLDGLVARAWRVRGGAAAGEGEGERGRGRTARAATARRALVDDTRAYLAGRVGESLTLAGIAAAVGSSPYHLARTFRRETGSSLHAWRLELRCRAALERVHGGERDLTRLALELGFSSHSHFTAVFRRTFGMAPSTLRARS